MAPRCICPHPDARECIELRCPRPEIGDDPRWFEEREECECSCHDDVDRDENGEEES